MNIIQEIYHNTIEDIKRDLHFWEDYLQKLESLDLTQYVDKLTVPILVPIGSRIFFRGDLKHTNEVTVSLGADYFVKCSLNQADILRQHRIKDAQSKVDAYRKEQEYIDNQFSFTKYNIYENQGQEIVEVYVEEEDKAWRAKHKENMREYKQKQKKEETVDHITDQELWERLEELELQEELENELLEVSPESCYNTERNEKSFVGKEDVITKSIKPKPKSNTEKLIDILQNEKDMNSDNQSKEITDKKVTFKNVSVPKQNAKLDLLQQVIDRQNELQNKLSELKNRERVKSKTEEDLLMKLDEIEQLDELEDEIDRLDDLLETEELVEKDEDVQSIKLQRRVSFADEDDSETLQLSFTHSVVEPNKEPYNPEKGIQKPSDLYQAYYNIMKEETTSILKKTRYEVDKVVNEGVRFTETNQEMNKKDLERQTILVSDVIEKAELTENKIEDISRPISLFKKKRLQNKS